MSGEDRDTRAPSVRLKPKMEIAAQLLASGSTQADASRDPRVKVTTSTMNIWCKKPEFRARIEQLRCDEIQQAQDKLAESVPDAVDAVIRIATQGGTPGVVASQFRAAKYILDMALKPPKMPDPKPGDMPGPDGEGMTDAEADELLGD